MRKRGGQRKISPEKQQLRHLRWSSQQPLLQKSHQLNQLRSECEDNELVMKDMEDHGDRELVSVGEVGEIVVLERLAPPQSLDQHQWDQDTWIISVSTLMLDLNPYLSFTNCSSVSDQDFVKERGIWRKCGQCFNMFLVQLLTWRNTTGEFFRKIFRCYLL